MVSEILISVIVTIAAIQIIKLMYTVLRKTKVKWGDVLADGGIVSAHTGAVTALCFSIYFIEGVSNLFFVSLVFSLIVLRDAIGVRRIARENANIIDKRFKLKRNIKEGHSFVEILLGAIVGVIVLAVVFVV